MKTPRVCGRGMLLESRVPCTSKQTFTCSDRARLRNPSFLVLAREQTLGLLGETAAQIVEGNALERGELEVLEHPGQDPAAAELYPLLDSHSGQGFDDLDPPDWRDHLAFQGLFYGVGRFEYASIHGTHDRNLWSVEINRIQDVAHLLPGDGHVR